jgi:hypothetical protein
MKDNERYIYIFQEFELFELIISVKSILIIFYVNILSLY